jgi:predicted transcriptional regulator
MLQLFINGFIKKSSGNNAKGFTYEVVSYEEYTQLQDSISNVLDETLQKLKSEVQSSKSVQKKNGLLKHKPAKELQEVVQ